MKNILVLVIALLVCLAPALSQDMSNYPISLTPMSGINSKANDYAPTVSSSKSLLYFTSTRDGGTGKADVYTSLKQGNAWALPVQFLTLNTPQHEGSLSFTSDGAKVVFAAEREGGYGDADIYIASVTNDGIVNIRNMGAAVNTKYWDSQPSISSDGKKVYFASNRPGGIGGTDVWVTVQDDQGRWSEARCMDQTINTSKDEVSPFITMDNGTLIFASKGHPGFGGFDLFYSLADGGSWSAPTNLGGIVNSDNDEMFYYASSTSDNFYLASSRNPENALDIYQGTPNLLGVGTMKLNVSVVDSLSGRPLPAIILIFDVAANIPIATISTNPDDVATQIALPARRAYRVEARVQGYPARSIDIPSVAANTSHNAKIMFGTIGFDFSNYQIPFFVTGYYRPNTSNNLAELFQKRKTDLKDATYIEAFEENSEKHQRYQRYSEVVETLFNNVVATAVDTVFPRFLETSAPDDVIEIVVYGYADPKPILGRYVEPEEVTFEDASGGVHTVKDNDKLTNLTLSGLRAYYSVKQIEQMIRSRSEATHSEAYSKLADNGKVRFRTVGGGVNTTGTDYAAQRRIKIDFVRLNGAGKQKQ